jgi:transcriptional regulator with XRE-family HTH domain
MENAYLIETKKEVVKVELVQSKVNFSQFVGHKVKTLREEAGLSQVEFLNKINEAISITHLKNIEKGLPTMRLRDIEAISKGLNVEPYIFLLPPNVEIVNLSIV